MFRKILIANRGEVAVRLARTAREMGVGTVGVVSSADREASWAQTFDEVVCIGGPAPRESYLRQETILQAALQTGCSAIHPGWGFLAEQPRFAALCEQHGITFIGPSANMMSKMGLKWPAKRTMRAAGLTVIPGSEGLLADADEASRVAQDTGFPVIIKADSGGGGRGMRLCHSVEDVMQAFPSARAEAESAFGSGALYLESYLTGGRHIEVQLMADSFGNAIHIGERECSIQRHHQKLIEESPSPALSDAERAELGRTAAEATARIGYRGAGTIEFLRRESDGQLCFMEMNTRLQVEHTVSEEVSGLDIVRAQLEVAANRPLGITQDDVKLTGHAIECRINAEDPSDDFRPTPGRLESFRFGSDVGPGRIRIDTHLQVGDEISPYYDSLIAKVIAWGETRAAAIETMQACLNASEITGVSTTIPLHLAVLASPEFQSGHYDTRSIPGWPASPAAVASSL
ncbi:MAG: acetyl-CoA carboxylase biotin carboxylase subunit [Planctomycetota bacterium]|jgi:acetyl-CoA carboxylase biotin carboxylase subunit